MFDDIDVAIIMAKDPRFAQAAEDLKSTSYPTFQAACITMQSIVRKALLQVIGECDDCNEHICVWHASCLAETGLMLESEDAPEFQGLF